MADKIRTNTDSLQKTKDQLTQELKMIRSALAKIETDLNTLNASWTGVAHDVFVQNIKDDLLQLDGACEGLDKIISFEGTAIKEYNQCESKVSQLIGAIKV